MNIEQMKLPEPDIAEGSTLFVDAYSSDSVYSILAARDAQWNALIAGREPVGYVCPSRLADLKAGRCTAINLVNKEEAQLLDLPGHGYPDIPLYAAPVAQPAKSLEQQLRDALEAMGSKRAQMLSAGDLMAVVCDVDAVAQPATEQAEAPSDADHDPLIEQSLAVLVDLICPDLDSGDIVRDAQEAMRVLNGRATQPTASNAGEREAFETWCLEYHEQIPKWTGTRYQDPVWIELWEAWQARAALASKPPQGEQKPVEHVRCNPSDFCAAQHQKLYTAPHPEQVST